MRILHLVPEPLPTHRPDVTALFGKYLPRLGLRCHMVGKGGGKHPVEGDYARVDVAKSAGGRLARELAYVWLCARRLLAASPREYDFIQVRDMVTIGLLGLVAARIRGVPFIYWMSFLMSEARIEHAMNAWRKHRSPRSLAVALKGYVEFALLYKVILPRAHHVFVQSAQMGRVVAARGIPEARLTAVPMGVDLESIAARTVVPRRPDGWEGVPLVAYLGTMDGQRKLGTLVDALAIVRRAVPQARLLLIGDSLNPKDVVDLREHARRLGLEDAVRVTGWLAGDEAWAFLKGADVAISPFPRGFILDTNSPTKVIEYLALGVPCVGNDNPDQKEVLEESGAGLMVQGSSEEYAKAIVEVLAELDAYRGRAARGPDYIRQRRSYAFLAEKVASTYERLRKVPA